jgi:hypothetical protein
VLSGEATDTNFIVLTQHVGLKQNGPHHHIIENQLLLSHDIAEKLLNR